MALEKNSFEGGTAGNNITAGTSGGASGDAFGIVNAGASNTITWDVGSAFHGGLGALFTKGGTSASVIGFIDLSGGAADLQARGYGKLLTALPAADGCTYGLQPRSTADAQLGSLRVTAAGLLQLLGPSTTIATGSVTLAFGNYYRYELQMTGTGTASTSYSGQVFLGDSTSPLDSISASGVTTAAQSDRLRFGNHGGTAMGNYAWDDVALNIGAGSALGPAVTTISIYPRLLTSNAAAIQAANR